MTKKRSDTIYGRRLREARDSYGFSQSDLGIEAGLDESGAGGRVSRYENSIHQPKLGMQQRFADVLEMPLAFFYTEDDEEARLIAEAARSDGPVQRLAEIRKRKKKKRK